MPSSERKVTRERREQPATGVVFEKVADRGSTVVVRLVDGTVTTTFSYGTWMTWERVDA